MTTYVTRADLSVATPIAEFAEETLSTHGLDADQFWAGVSDIVHELGPRGAELLRVREDLQAQIDSYHRENPGRPDPVAYREFLTRIGYLTPTPSKVQVTTSDVAPEVALQAGPQLVVPILNARFALNAVNARWGSLYDALYGTDAISREGDLAPGATFNAQRGAAVIARGRELLDQVAPLTAVSGDDANSSGSARASHADAVGYRVEAGSLRVALADGSVAQLEDPAAFAGYAGDPAAPSSVLLKHHGLHVEVVIDETGAIGRDDKAHVQDIVLEAALTTIIDLEDSVAAVDAADKSLGYRNWRGLMDGSLEESFTKGGRTITRRMNPDRGFTSPTGEALTLPGRSVLFIRNVGHLMTGDAVLDRTGAWTGEGIIDAIMTALGSLADLRGTSHLGELANSRTPSMYIVKPKMHGPDEVAFTATLFARVEQLLGLPERTLKVGIMDEERRTSANLAACIAAASDRVVFINTGFLDRTGDEIHTSMQAGPFLPKAALRDRGWLGAYEQRNVGIGVACGLTGHAQIGKGMWAMPDLMHDMIEQKGAHVQTGASTAWVPSPVAATLHTLHYHQIDAFAARAALPAFDAAADEATLSDLLDPPLAAQGDLTPEIVARELDNNAQSILGYVVRWIDQGVGCSKVPDIDDIALMEDRATLRISSQLLANWLTHGVITEADVDAALGRLAAVVDQQNAGDPLYEALLGADGSTPGVAFEAARRLIIEGAAQPSGYTEPILHELRRAKKAGAR